MLRVFVLFAALLAVASSAAITKTDPALVSEVTELLEDFRAIMRTGRADLNIPVLEPAVIETMPVDVKLSPFDLEAEASDVAVSGVSAFKILKLTQIPGTNRLSVAIEVPEVDVLGHYEINGKVKIGFVDISLSGGKGPVSLKMRGFRGTATANMIVNEDGTLNLSWIRFDTWNFDDVTAQLENVVLGNVINPLINKVIPVFLQLNRNWINDWGENVAKVVVNRYLDGIAGRTSLQSTAAYDRAMPSLTGAARDA